MSNIDNTQAGLLRRLATFLYDGLLILALVLIATALTLPFHNVNKGDAGNILMSIYLITVVFLFFGWFWTHGGQTLGMRAWRIKLIANNGSEVSWDQALVRFLIGLPAWLLFIVGLMMNYSERDLGILLMPDWGLMLLGAVWIAADNWPGLWRDQLSRTKVVVLPKIQKTA
ncbi:MAG: RDD family protein [Gammaproteobacteria bacterium]|nr:RDD family protein [Gammaproteobacteria bacterium]